MYQIRNGVFETNSSSVHSICIGKSPVEIPKWEIVKFTIGEYGWENATVVDTASYLYTGILSLGREKEYLPKLKSMLDDMGVKYEFDTPHFDKWGLEYGYVDHAEGLHDFIKAVLSDSDLLARYLFGDSFIKTGNDNENARPDGCDICKKEIYDLGKKQWVPNHYHDPEHYDYFKKGN